MKCDKFVNNWFENSDNSFTEVIIFRFESEIFHHIYDTNALDFVQKPFTVEASSLKKIPFNETLTRFAKEVSSYIDHPQMMKDELFRESV